MDYLIPILLSLLNLSLILNYLALSKKTTSIQKVNNMGIGINLGNVFDSYNNIKNITTPDEQISLWNNEIPTKKMILNIKKNGFKTIRVPITWLNFIDETGKINSEWMKRIKEVVTWIINYNINCIIIDDLNRNKCTLRRTREVIRQNKKVKKICKDNKYLRNNNLFFEFDDMKFEIAILIDNRNFCEKFLCEIKDNCIIILLFFRKDIIFKQIKISSFILSCTLDYFFNAFFYSEIYLEQIYEHNKIITFLIDYPKEIFATLASQFLVKLIELLLEDKALSLLLKRIAYQNKYYLKGVNYLLKKYEKRFYIYITIGYLMLGITWYYTCAFCTVYQNSQIKLLYDTLESFVLNLILPFPISFLTVTFRHLAIKKLNKFFFIISNIFRIFS